MFGFLGLVFLVPTLIGIDNKNPNFTNVILVMSIFTTPQINSLVRDGKNVISVTSPPFFKFGPVNVHLIQSIVT